MKDIIIIGRGLAGATLSFELLKRGIPHEIFDEPTLSSSSKVAAGLINPIVLKRLKMVQEADLFMRLLPEYYQKLEKLTGQNFYNPAIIEHIYASVGEQNLWEEKKDLAFHSSFLKGQKTNPYINVNAPYGLGVMQGTAWLDTEAYLHAHYQYSTSNGIVIQHRQLQINEISELVTNGHKVILCNGHLLKDLDLIPDDIFTPTRGEVMTIKTDGLPTNTILHSSIFTIPLGNSLFKVGATYHWDNFKDETTPEGLNKLKEDLEKIFNGSYKVVEHLAGVRPNIKDRKPIMGEITPNLYTFNGMGSRAVLMTPYLANLFTDYLINSNPIPSKYDLQRFIK